MLAPLHLSLNDIAATLRGQRAAIDSVEVGIAQHPQPIATREEILTNLITFLEGI